MQFPRFWQAELKSPTGNTSATLFLNTYLGNDEAPQGYIVTGPGGKKPEISEAHQDGNMLGFDMTVQGLNGKPLKVSVLGKKSRNRIAGVFLDYSGTPGTWTAVPQAPKAKPIRKVEGNNNSR